MITEEEFKKRMTSEGINCFNVVVKSDSFEKSQILLENNDINELIMFMKVNNIKNVFYTYSFYREDYYIIDEELMNEFDKELMNKFDEELMNEFDEEIYSLLLKDIKEHNKQIERLDFSRPGEMHIFCIYESNYISINDYDFWCDELGIVSAKEKIVEIIEDNKETIDRKLKERKLIKQVLKEEFRNYVLNDDEFKKCTNQRLRRDYMYLVFERDEAKKYKPMFSYYNSFDISSAVNFIEMLWREYKLQM